MLDSSQAQDVCLDFFRSQRLILWSQTAGLGIRGSRMQMQSQASLSAATTRRAAAPRSCCPLAVSTGERHFVQLSHAHAPTASLVRSRAGSSRRIACKAIAAPPTTQAQLPLPGRNVNQLNVVYKFGGSSVRDAERMREVADIICSFPDYLPVVVLSAMGKSTNMLLECGDLALTSELDDIPTLAPLRALRKLHFDTCDELGVEASVKAEVQQLLDQLQQLLIGVAIMKDLTPRAKDSLVSFGERLSTRIFASYLRSQGVPARQYDAGDLGVITTDDFTNADVLYDMALPRIKQSLTAARSKNPREVPIVTGFLGRGVNTGAITTLGRGGSDLTATVLGAALELEEVQVWKDVDGVLTSDPRIVPNTRPVNQLTFEEATELAYFGAQVLHPQAMQPAIRAKQMGVRVKNSYNRTAPGTVISAQRDMSDVLVTSIVLKNNVTLVDMCSTRMMGQYGFLATVFDSFRRHKISVDVVATSEVSVSCTLDPKKVSDLHEELMALKADLGKIATVNHRENLAIVSLICNVEKTSNILQKVFDVLEHAGINVVMMSQGASKTNISLVVDGAQGVPAVQALHAKFFDSNGASN